MNEYRVRVTRTRRYDVVVRGASRRQAEEKAALEPMPLTDGEDDCRTDALCRLGEPWVTGWSGEPYGNFYDGRPDQYMDTNDLLVFKRAFGFTFSTEEVALLRARVESEVGVVRETWNGSGCDTLSIRLASPFGKLTDAQVTKLMLPR